MRQSGGTCHAPAVGGNRVCIGCLDSEQCWVCQGQGILESRAGEIAPCHRCYGSGRCPLCREIRLTDIEEPPLVQTLKRDAGQ